MSRQFVPFRDYMDRTGNHVLSMARLAKDVLAEIPDQLISYMKSRAIKPNPVPPAYSTIDQPQTNPVWTPLQGSMFAWARVGIDWKPAFTPALLGEWRCSGGPLVNIRWEDDETNIFVREQYKTALGQAADDQGVFLLSVWGWER